MKYIKYTLKTMSLFFKTSLKQIAIFRFDFFISVINSLLLVVGSVGGAIIVFNKVDTINGWDFYETLLVTAVFMFLQSIKNLFLAPSFSSISGLGGELWTGSFDFTLLKPLPVQYYISVKDWAPLTVFDTLISIVIFVIAIVEVKAALTIKGLILFVIMLIVALVILYSIMLILTAGAFWYLGTPLLWIFDSLMETGRYPVKIYPVVFKFILTWIIPIGVVVTFPAEVLMGQLNIFEILLSIVIAVGLFIISSIFFKKSVNKYSSASS